MRNQNPSDFGEARLRVAGNIRRLRLAKGLSQEKMAEQLGIGTSAYKMAEQGRRGLATRALTEIARFEIKLSVNNPGDADGSPHPAEHGFVAAHKESYDRLFAREDQCRKLSRRLQFRLEALKKIYGRSRDWIRIMEEMGREQPGEKGNREWWKRQHKMTLKKLQHCGLPAQVLLKARIALLNAEAALYRNMKEQLNKELPAFFTDPADPANP